MTKRPVGRPRKNSIQNENSTDSPPETPQVALEPDITAPVKRGRKPGKKVDVQEEESGEGKSPKEQRLALLEKQLTSRYPGKIFRGEEYTSPWMIKRLPTGLIDLDIATQGGYPAGGVTFHVGKEGVGKNWLANQVIANQQRIYGNDCAIAVVSTEMPYDKDFSIKCGVAAPFSPAEMQSYIREYEDTHNQPPPAEEIEKRQRRVGTFLTIPPDVANRLLQIVIDLAKSREFNVILVDSFGSLLTENESEKSLDENAQAMGPAALNTRFANHLVPALGCDDKGRPNLTALIAINQARDNTNRATPYSPELKESGGWALKHLRWLSIMLTRIGHVTEKRGGKDVRVGKKIKWEVTKQKAGGFEGHTGEYEYIWSRAGIDTARHVLSVAVSLGVVTAQGNWLYYQGQALGNGLVKAAESLSEDTVRELAMECLHCSKIAPCYNPESIGLI